MKLVLFGAGDVASHVLAHLPANYKVVALADNNPKRQGLTVGGLPVLRPEDIATVAPEGILIALVSPHHSAVREQLRTLRLDHLEIPPPRGVNLRPFDLAYEETRGVIGAQLVAEIEQSKGIAGSVFYDVLLGNYIKRVCDRYLGDVSITALHAGMMRSLGIEIYSALRWGWNWTSVEPYPVFPERYPFDDHFAAMRDVVRLFHWDTVPGIPPRESTRDTNTWHIRDSKITYLPSCSVEMVPNESRGFNLCFSHAVLEHVERPMDFFQKSYELMAENGIGIHRIDLRDHVDFAKPLEFLTLDTHEWDIVRQNALQGHLNRYRMSHYRSFLIASGFQILDEFIYDRNAAEYVERMRPRLRAPFQTCSDADLFTAGVEFVVRKPDSKSRPPT